VHVLRVVRARPLHVLRKARLGRVAARIALREHLLQQPEAVVADQRLAARSAAHLDEMLLESLEVVAIVGHVLARVVAVPLDEARDLRLRAPIDAFDERDAEVAVIDAPELHAARRISRAHVVDALDELAALDLDVEPRPLLDRAGGAGVRDVIDFTQERHDGPPSIRTPLYRAASRG
jgi:hypothetical protein